MIEEFPNSANYLLESNLPTPIGVKSTLQIYMDTDNVRELVTLTVEVVAETLTEAEITITIPQETPE